MATSKTRITVSLSENRLDYVRNVALEHGKSLSWAIEKIIVDHMAGEFRVKQLKKQFPRIEPDYDPENPQIEKK